MTEADNLMPNDGTYFGIPKEDVEQEVERKKEKAKTLESLSIIKDIISHFDERIEFRDKLSSIGVSIEVDPLLHQKLCEVNKMLKLALEEEKQLLEDLIDSHAKNR